MKLTHREHGTFMAREDRTLRGAAERYVQWKNRTMSFDPGPTRYTHSLGMFVGLCHGLFFLVLTGCSAFMTWVACIIGFLPGVILGAIGTIFFCIPSLMMSWAVIRTATLLILTKGVFHGSKIRGPHLSDSGSSRTP